VDSETGVLSDKKQLSGWRYTVFTGNIFYLNLVKSNYCIRFKYRNYCCTFILKGVIYCSFGMMDEVGENCTYAEQFCDLYRSPNVIRLIIPRLTIWVGVCGGEDKYIQDFVDKICSKEDTWKSRHRYNDNIKIYLKEMGWEDMYWVQLAQDRDMRLAVVNTVMNGQVP